MTDDTLSAEEIRRRKRIDALEKVRNLAGDVATVGDTLAEICVPEIHQQLGNQNLILGLGNVLQTLANEIGETWYAVSAVGEAEGKTMGGSNEQRAQG